MEEFLRFVINNLVEYPDEVIITSVEKEDRIIFCLAMRKSDLGRVIGRAGHTINALRNVLSAAADKRGLKVDLQIVE
ncbi:MAG: KH domain-containing protein [Chthoniobacterales bacterium]